MKLPKILPSWFSRLGTHRKAAPVGLKKPMSLEEIVKMHLTDPQTLNRMRSNEHETFEDADDFDIGDDYDRTTPYEENFDLAAVQAQQLGYVQDAPEVNPDVNKKILDGFRNAKKRSKNPFRKFAAKTDGPLPGPSTPPPKKGGDT